MSTHFLLVCRGKAATRGFPRPPSHILGWHLSRVRLSDRAAGMAVITTQGWRGFLVDQHQLPDEWHGLCVCSAESRAFSCVCGLQSNEDQQGEDGTDRLDGSSGTAQGSTLLSRELWSTHEGRQRLEKSPPSCVVKSPNFCWKYRKCFIPWGNLGCWLKQGYTTASRDGITSQSSADLSHYPCVVHIAPAVRCNRRVWASNMPCRHLRKTHTHACLDSISLWGPPMHFPASYANSNPITTKCLTLPKNPQTLDVVHSRNVLTL